MFEITFTADAIQDLRLFRKAERKRILEALESQLRYEPAVETQNRKRLRPNRLAEWELRVDRFRVFFDIARENRLIQVVGVGYKRGSCLFLRGQEYKL